MIIIIPLFPLCCRSVICCRRVWRSIETVSKFCGVLQPPLWYLDDCVRNVLSTKWCRYYIHQPLLCQKCLVDEAEQVLHTSAVTVSEMSCWWSGAGITYISRYCVRNVLLVNWSRYYIHQPLLCRKCLVSEVVQVLYTSAITVSEVSCRWSGAGVSCISCYCVRNVDKVVQVFHASAVTVSEMLTKWSRYYLHQPLLWQKCLVNEVAQVLHASAVLLPVDPSFWTELCMESNSD